MESVSIDLLTCQQTVSHDSSSASTLPPRGRLERRQEKVSWCVLLRVYARPALYVLPACKRTSLDDKHSWETFSHVQSE